MNINFTRPTNRPQLRIVQRAVLLTLFTGLAVRATLGAESAVDQLRLRVSWGHQSPGGTSFYLRFLTNDVVVSQPASQGFESGDRLEDGAWITHAGGGHVDAIECTLRYPVQPVTIITNLQRIWSDLIARSDPDTAHRLQQDPAYRLDSRRLTFQMDAEGTRGFSITVDQLLQSKSLWVPALDVFVAAGDPLESFSDHQQQLQRWKGQRILDQIERGPEATYEEFKARWQDMGHPAYRNPAQTGPGQIVCLTWDSAMFKFGVDRGSGVWNDYGNPDRFHVWLDFAEVAQNLSASWKGQKLAQGLPVITTILEREGIRYEIEQFAYPLHGPPQERRGDIPMVLLEKVTLTNSSDHPVSTPVKLRHRRLVANAAQVRLGTEPNLFVLRESESRSVFMAVEGEGLEGQLNQVGGPERSKQDNPQTAWQTSELVLNTEVPAHGSRQFIVRLPSPSVPPEDQARLLALNYSAARQQTLAFWSDYLARGARFNVPESAVNELFRANLWHALRLPRRHGGAGPDVKIDLPYSNFAYDQEGTPWPVNQAVYVDYMIYDLRGYPQLSAEELRAIYTNNQEPNGHVGGFANWGVYTPAMVYSVAKNYLLSGDRPALDSLLPETLKALDWCLSEINKGKERSGASSGLVRAPLNDGTGDGIWAFNQAYFYAALHLLGKALKQIEHSRAQECVNAADAFRRSVERGFGAATMLSPLVPLRDHTWTPYVPCEALTPHRILRQWYPTDVDTGATHLPRLKALAPDGLLSDALLQDHEDNLYLHGWGMANEPVYNQQATTYLLRDNPKAAIRAFYSMMACAFSHSVFEPVEHRWTWGQYFGPPSTDGAWFELYRHLLIQERDDDSLLLLQATPRKWLEDGQKISIERAPTYYGNLSLTVESHAASGKLLAEIDLPDRSRPRVLLLRLRHPKGQPIHSVTVNGQAWTDFDAQKEWVRIPDPRAQHYSIVSEYSSNQIRRPRAEIRDAGNGSAGCQCAQHQGDALVGKERWSIVCRRFCFFGVQPGAMVRTMSRSFLVSLCLGAVLTIASAAAEVPVAASTNEPTGLRLAVFDIDATPPIGSLMAYDPVTNKWDLSLRARGVVLLGAGQPIVLCAVDWIGIANESYDAFRGSLALAAGTTPSRVAVHTLHQHDAPDCDFSAEQILKKAGQDARQFESGFQRQVLSELQRAVRVALAQAQPITHIGLGEARVEQVASNRRILGADGKVRAVRYTSCKDAALRAEPEGTIDPMVALISFWNADKPVAVLSYYATHPQSYYRTGIPNPDFPGVARFLRQLTVPGALHIHFNGAGGNVGAGKYNDGSPENRGVLAERLAEGMRRAWEATKREPLTPDNVDWRVESVLLPPAKDLDEDRLEAQLSGGDARFFAAGGPSRLAWLRRSKAGHRIEVSCLRLGRARVLHMPGELFVEYQLAAKAERPDLFVAMAAYGDYGPWYIGTAIAYEQGGYETTPPASNVGPGAEAELLGAIRKLLRD